MTLPCAIPFGCRYIARGGEREGGHVAITSPFPPLMRGGEREGGHVTIEETGGGLSYEGVTIDGFDQLVLSGPGPWPGILVGMTITGPGVPLGTTVLGIGGIDGNVITMSDAATSAESGTYDFA